MNFLSTNSSSSLSDDIIPVSVTPSKISSTLTYEQNNEQYLQTFATWNEYEQIHFVENLLKQMQSHQHGQVNTYLLPMLKRDFVGRLAFQGLVHVAEKILGYLDDQSLK